MLRSLPASYPPLTERVCRAWYVRVRPLEVWDRHFMFKVFLSIEEKLEKGLKFPILKIFPQQSERCVAPWWWWWHSGIQHNWGKLGELWAPCAEGLYQVLLLPLPSSLSLSGRTIYFTELVWPSPHTRWSEKLNVLFVVCHLRQISLSSLVWTIGNTHVAAVTTFLQIHKLRNIQHDHYNFRWKDHGWQDYGVLNWLWLWNCNAWGAFYWSVDRGLWKDKILLIKFFNGTYWSCSGTNKHQCTVDRHLLWKNNKF